MTPRAVPGRYRLSPSHSRRIRAVLALYHDQGHIPIKVHGFEASVSVALGLPFLRTSVDHGTAFDIAGKGIADSQSMVEAIITAINLIKGTGKLI